MSKTNNYFYSVIKNSEYLQFRIKELLGDDKGLENYFSCNEIISMSEKFDNRLIITPILKAFVWFYNLKISIDSRNNIEDYKVLRRDLRKLQKGLSYS